MAPAKEDLYRVEMDILPTGKLIVVFAGLAFSLLIAFVDQNAIGLALPTIGNDLNCASTIAWAGTSSLIANTVFQVLYGRLSDIFGRKVVFLTGVGLLSFGDLLCSFAKTGPQLYAFRGIAGVGTGGITALTMMIVSDIVTLENRGKYQGILGSCIGLGNTIGPFLAAAFIEHTTWRALFWCVCPLGALSGLIVAFILPKSKVIGDPKAKAKAIDYYGILFSTTGVILLLIPISGGGTYFNWNSPMVIAMLVIGGVSSVLFIYTEWKIALMPMMHMRLFRNPAVAATLMQSFLFGIVYFSHLYYLPIYYQEARQYSPLKAASLTIPFVAGQSVISVCAGQYISRMKRYGEVIWTGFTLWTLGTGLILLFNRTTPDWKIIVILITEGMGVGNVFQPSLIAAQAHTRKHDRAIVISVRNFLRSLGGAVGLAMSAAIFSNVLRNQVNAFPPSISLRNQIIASVLHVPDLSSLSAADENIVLDAYMAASRGVFIMWVPMIGTCLCLCYFVKDRGLKRKEELEEEKRAAAAAAGDSGVTVEESSMASSASAAGDIMERVVEQAQDELELEALEAREGDLERGGGKGRLRSDGEEVRSLQSSKVDEADDEKKIDHEVDSGKR